MNDKPVSGTGNPKPFSLLRMFLAISAIVAAIAVGLGLIVMSDIHPSLSSIEKYSSLEFPSSAKLLESYRRRFLEIHILAKIEMDRADVETFVNSLPEPREISETDMLDLDRISPGMDWWDLRSARRYKAIKFGKREWRNNEYCRNRGWNILIKLDDPDKAVVYLRYSSFTSY